MDFFGRVLDHAFADVHERRGQFFQVRVGRFVLQLHDLGGIDHRPAAQRDDLIRLVVVERFHPLQNDLHFRLGIGDDTKHERGPRAEVGDGRRPRSRICSMAGLVMMMVELDCRRRRFSTAFMLK